MVLVDTSVWVDHFRHANRALIELLQDGLVCCHPFIIGELAAGYLFKRAEILSLMKSLPENIIVTMDEYLHFIEKNSLWDKGIGFVDIHLLASCRISGSPIWTLDKKLKLSAIHLELAYPD